MRGYPRFKEGDKVYFKMWVGNELVCLYGLVYIVDEYGTFDYPHDVCYDIMVEKFGNEGQCLVKHIPEKEVKGIYGL